MCVELCSADGVKGSTENQCRRNFRPVSVELGQVDWERCSNTITVRIVGSLSLPVCVLAICGPVGAKCL